MQNFCNIELNYEEFELLEHALVIFFIKENR